MAERYPVGTQVQVKNDGHGSQFRTEAERVGEFAGTVIATNGPDYTGIPEVCVESATGERRVILVGDLEEAPEPTPEEKPASEFQVKIWYVENGYEEIDHAPAHVATTIYAEAEDNPRVIAAEIHGCATHKLHQSFRRELDAAPVVG